MELTIKVKESKTLTDVAIKIQQFNTIAEALLVNGPIAANPDAPKDEDKCGDGCTPLNAYGYSTIVIANYRKLILDPQMLGFFADTFDVIIGAPVETDENGNDVYGGAIA
jgi:hypothetical protein